MSLNNGPTLVFSLCLLWVIGFPVSNVTRVENTKKKKKKGRGRDSTLRTKHKWTYRRRIKRMGWRIKESKMQSSQRSCLAGISNSAHCFTKCMRKQWILLGYSTERHNRKREQKEDLQLLRCPLFILVFFWLQWVVSSVWKRRAWIRMSGTKTEWARADRTSATRFGFKRKATAWGIWYTQYTPLSQELEAQPCPSLYSRVFNSSDM